MSVTTSIDWRKMTSSSEQRPNRNSPLVSEPPTISPIRSQPRANERQRHSAGDSSAEARNRPDRRPLANLIHSQQHERA
jgi:hypothetical protein